MPLDLGIDLSNVTDIGLGKVNDQLLHDGPLPIFIIKTKKLTESFWDFEVRDITEWYEDNTPLKTEPYVDGNIKWDGCCNWDFARMIHWCNYGDLAKHVQLMMYLYEYAASAIKNADPDGFKLRG